MAVCFKDKQKLKRGVAMRATDIITKKRNGEKLTGEEINFLINGYVAHEIPDYQISAWLMAVFFKGMDFEETGILTEAMLRSGSVINLHGITPLADKHSTGGVGDKISLPLAPIVASLGVYVPMMSGRALGYTGGTLDKLDSIEGYKTSLFPEEFRRILEKDGYAMTGQSESVVPADRLLYALRDVTGTVESIPLITASILSKKIAEGAESLVFDVKWGSGAFMKTKDAATALAESLLGTAKAMGKKAAAIISNMNTPLGYKIGNFLEIEETLDCLRGKGPEDVMELTYNLGALMLLLSGKTSSIREGIEKCRKAVNTGEPLNRFLRNVESQGGNPEQLLKQEGKMRSPWCTKVTAEKTGWITGYDALSFGKAGVFLGVGRNKTEDKVSPTAGIIMKKKPGDFVNQGEEILEIYGQNEESLKEGVKKITGGINISGKKNEPENLIYKIIM